MNNISCIYHKMFHLAVDQYTSNTYSMSMLRTVNLLWLSVTLCADEGTFSSHLCQPAPYNRMAKSWWLSPPLLQKKVDGWQLRATNSSLAAMQWWGLIYYSIKKKYLPTYFFSNSPVKCLFTNVVFPVPPSPTNTSCERRGEGTVWTGCYWFCTKLLLA